jgi:hypothetical protein
MLTSFAKCSHILTLEDKVLKGGDIVSPGYIRRGIRRSGNKTFAVNGGDAMKPFHPMPEKAHLLFFFSIQTDPVGQLVLLALVTEYLSRHR